MRSIIIFSVVVFFIANLSVAQPWMKQPYLKVEKQNATFYDIQNAFYSWWGNRPYEKGKGYMQFKRWELEMKSKTGPDGKMPDLLKYSNEYHRFMDKFYATGSAYKNITANENWTPLGITEWELGYSGYNPGNGRVNGVTVDPSNPNVIFIAAPSGGVWKSADGGATWNTTFDNQDVLGSSTVAVNPFNSNIVYAGTGDRDAADNQSIGVLKSLDGGATWNATGLHYSATSNNINKILINPLNPNTIFAATSSKIYRSVNGGITWLVKYVGSSVTDLEYKPGDTTTLYGSGDFFIKSTNSGNSFSHITNGLPSDAGRVEIAVTPANPQVVYLIAANTSDYGFLGIYKSSDAGISFTEQSTSPNILGYETDGSDAGGQGWYDLAIAASPADENEIFTGGVNIWKSYDGGVSMEPVTMWYSNSGWAYTHADIHYLHFFGDILYCGSDGGVYSSPDYGTTWSDLSAGLGITQFYRLGGSKNHPAILVAGAQDNGCNLYKNNGWTHVFGADGMECIVDFSNSNNIYISVQSGYIQKSNDGGDNFQDVSPATDGNWITPYVMSQTNAQVLYAAYTEVYKTTNGGLNWMSLSDNLTGGVNLEYLAVAPSNENHIYAALSSELYYTHDGGATWSASTPNAYIYITGIAVHDTDPQKLWICGSSGSYDIVMKSDDGGISFTDISGNLTNMGFNTIAFQKNSNDGLYLGTQAGIFYKDTLLVNWIPFNNGLPNVIVKEFEINYTAGKIRAATYGRGIWESLLYDSSVNVSENELEKSFSVNPNPAKKFVNLDVNFIQPSDLDIYIYNISGSPVKNLNYKNCTSVSEKIDMSAQAPGTYFVKIKANGQSLVKRVTLLK